MNRAHGAAERGKRSSCSRLKTIPEPRSRIQTNFQPLPTHFCTFKQGWDLLAYLKDIPQQPTVASHTISRYFHIKDSEIIKHKAIHSGQLPTVHNTKWTTALCHEALHTVVILLLHPLVVRPLGHLPEHNPSTQPRLNLLFIHFILPQVELRIHQQQKTLSTRLLQYSPNSPRHFCPMQHRGGQVYLHFIISQNHRIL